METILIDVDRVYWFDDIPYRDIDMNHVASLIAMNEPDTWPAIIVTPYEGAYGLIAGQHRIMAASELKRKQLRAEIRNYPSREAMLVAMWEDNAKHGLSYSVKERKEYALNLHHAEPSLSYREIGRRAGLPHQTVKRAIDAAQEQSTGNTERDSYNAHNRNRAKRLKTAAFEFFLHENKRWIGTGGTSARDTEHRALLLAEEFKDEQDAVKTLHSLAQAFELAAKRLGQTQKSA